MNRHIAILLAAAVAAALSSCRDGRGEGFLSSATVDADLWKISPAVSGTLAAVSVREGDSVAAGQVVAAVDSVPLALKAAEIEASIAELSANVAAKVAENRVLEAAHRGAVREDARSRTLAAQGAATVRASDDARTQFETSEARLAAARSAVAALRARGGVLRAQLGTMRDQIARCSMAAPASGTVLSRFRNAGEAAIPGRPVLEIGRVDTLWAEFFVPQTALASLKVGAPLRLRLDAGSGERWVPARLSWVSSEAEFTPKGVQTREARNELVYRCRALAANPQGALKRGMPVEVWE